MQYVLAASSSTGYTVVWDLRGKREVAGLVYGGGTGTLSGPPGYPTGGLAVGGRRGMSDVAWHPDNVRLNPSLRLSSTHTILRAGHKAGYIFRRRHVSDHHGLGFTKCPRSRKNLDRPREGCPLLVLVQTRSRFVALLRQGQQGIGLESSDFRNNWGGTYCSLQ